MVQVREIRLADGRTLVVHDSGQPTGALIPTILWHHGSPQTGAPLQPLLDAAAARGIRMVSYARASYGGSSPNPGRDVASAASDVRQLAEALGLSRFAVMGASGGGPHALACAALMPERVTAAACFASLAPFAFADQLSATPAPATSAWFAGMASDGASLRAARNGRDARLTHELTTSFDPTSFIAADYDALDGAWAALADDVGRSARWGPDGLIDDDLAFVTPWGFSVADIHVPVLLAHGGRDRVVPPSHSEWLAGRIPNSELWLQPDDGHISILAECAAAMDWLFDPSTPLTRHP